jgi:hypothetical protein
MASIKDEVRTLTRGAKHRRLADLLCRLNPVLGGWFDELFVWLVLDIGAMATPIAGEIIQLKSSVEVQHGRLRGSSRPHCR